MSFHTIKLSRKQRFDYQHLYLVNVYKKKTSERFFWAIGNPKSPFLGMKNATLGKMMSLASYVSYSGYMIKDGKILKTKAALKELVDGDLDAGFFEEVEKLGALVKTDKGYKVNRNFAFKGEQFTKERYLRVSTQAWQGLKGCGISFADMGAAAKLFAYANIYTNLLCENPMAGADDARKNALTPKRIAEVIGKTPKNANRDLKQLVSLKFEYVFNTFIFCHRTLQEYNSEPIFLVADKPTYLNKPGAVFVNPAILKCDVPATVKDMFEGVKTYARCEDI